jgi:hypothetical protein
MDVSQPMGFKTLWLCDTFGGAPRDWPYYKPARAVFLLGERI